MTADRAPRHFWVHSMLIPPGAALLGACVRYFGEYSRKLNDPPVPGVYLAQAIITFGGFALERKFIPRNSQLLLSNAMMSVKVVPPATKHGIQFRDDLLHILPALPRIGDLPNTVPE